MKQLEKARKYEELYKELFDRNSKVTTICLLLWCFLGVKTLRVE